MLTFVYVSKRCYPTAFTPYLTLPLQMYAGVIILDGNKLRFSVSDWKTMLAIKVLRIRLREILSRSFKTPGKPLPPSLLRWFEIWQDIFTREERK
jgi:ATP-dependent RNA helicase DHX29